MHVTSVETFYWKVDLKFLCDTKVPAKLKRKFHRATTRPMMLYETKFYAVMNMSLLHWMFGENRHHKIRNDNIRESMGNT